MNEPSANASLELTELVEALPFPALRYDSKVGIVFMNRAFRQLLERFNLREEEAAGVLPDGFQAQLTEVLNHHGPAFELFKNVAERILEFTFVPIRAQSHALVIVRDQTEHKKAAEWVRGYAEKLEQANQRMQETQTQLLQTEKMAALGQLVAGIAHEINTPIGSINSNNDILIRSVGKIREFLSCAECPKEVREDPEVLKIMGILEDVNRNNHIACDRIMNIIRSLKNFARVDQVERKRVNIHEGIDSSLILVYHQLKNRIQVVKEYGDLPQIECYPSQLNQVFMNLLVNAEQAMPEKGTITIKTFRDGESVKVAIRDTGIGIPKENLSKIFDPGFTTKGVGVGTGLGLSICHKIIQDHHGKITVESEVGKGTTFTIVLPIR
jgi:two-component system NtrC family sensor kinase